VAKTRDVLVHVDVEVGAGKRTCNHSRKHSIPKGTAHLAVKGGSYRARKNYCSECAKSILDAAKERLREMEKKLTA